MNIFFGIFYKIVSDLNIKNSFYFWKSNDFEPQKNQKQQGFTSNEKNRTLEL